MEKAKSVCRRAVRLFAENKMPRSAAGLSYFLTLAFFPLLICLYMMLGRFFPDAGNIREFLTGILPQATVSTITDYLLYVSGNISLAMRIAAFAVLAMASSAGFRLIGGAMESMRGQKHFSAFFEIIFSFIYSLIFLVAIYFAVLLTVAGKDFLDTIDSHILFVNISAAWSWMRFVLLFLLLFVILSGVYQITGPRDGTVCILPGAFAASFALVGTSILFSYFISFTVRLIIYGSLASIIIVMFWLYICGLILFAGGALNVALEEEKKSGRSSQ